MRPLGGSELAFQELIHHVTPGWQQDINLVLSTCRHEFIDPTKINVVWQQLSYDQENVKLMANREFVDKVDYFVYVSSWNYEKFRMYFNTPEHKSLVIKNATRAFAPVVKPKTEKLKLIYTSTPWRGLETLLMAFPLLDRDDIELDIYSSSIIYGDNFHRQFGDQYTQLFNYAKSLKNVNYMGYASNSGVRRAVEKAHIFAYPCTFEETSCMSAIEAGSSGCQMVTTNFGALYETCADWATYVPYNANKQKLAIEYAKVLNSVIDNYWSDENQSKLASQVEYYNRFYSWENRAIQWGEFFDRIRKEKA